MAVAIMAAGMASSVARAGQAPAHDTPKERSINITGRVVNQVTGLGFQNDTIKVELLRPDSTLITYTYTTANNRRSELNVENYFRIRRIRWPTITLSSGCRIPTLTRCVTTSRRRA